MNYVLLAVASFEAKELPPPPLNNPMSALQLRDEVEVKPDDVRGACFSASHCMRKYIN